MPPTILNDGLSLIAVPIVRRLDLPGSVGGIAVMSDGQMILNSAMVIQKAAIAGFGVAFLPEHQMTARPADGSLVRMPKDRRRPFPGYDSFYPRRRQSSSAPELIVDALRIAADIELGDIHVDRLGILSPRTVWFCRCGAVLRTGGMFIRAGGCDQYAERGESK